MQHKADEVKRKRGGRRSKQGPGHDLCAPADKQGRSVSPTPVFVGLEDPIAHRFYLLWTLNSFCSLLACVSSATRQIFQKPGGPMAYSMGFQVPFRALSNGIWSTCISTKLSPPTCVLLTGLTLLRLFSLLPPQRCSPSKTHPTSPLQWRVPDHLVFPTLHLAFPTPPGVSYSPAGVSYMPSGVSYTPPGVSYSTWCFLHTTWCCRSHLNLSPEAGSSFNKARNQVLCC